MLVATPRNLEEGRAKETRQALVTWGAGKMGYRAVFLDGVVFLLWAFACSVSFWTYGFNLLLGSFGVVFGLVYGGVITLWQLKII
jgi:hypothetical protein